MINVTSSLYPFTLPPTHYHTLPPSHHHTLTPSHHHTLTLTPSATYTPSRDETSRCGSDAEAHSSLWGSAIGWRQHPPWSGQLQSLQVSPQSDSNSSIQWFSILSFPFKVYSDSNNHNQQILNSFQHPQSIPAYSILVSIHSPFSHTVGPVLIVRIRQTKLVIIANCEFF